MSGPTATSGADATDQDDLTDRRRIGSVDWQGSGRFAWIAAIRRSSGLSLADKYLATTLALEWARREATCHPGTAAIVAETGMSLAAVKRSLVALEAAGWIAREGGGRGRGNSARIVFLSRAQIVPLKRVAGEPFKGAEKGRGRAFYPDGKGSRVSLLGEEKGSQSDPKRLAGEPLHYKAQSIEKHKGARDLDDVARFWADVIQRKSHVPPSAITSALAARIVALGLLTEAELRAAGVAC